MSVSLKQIADEYQNDLDLFGSEYVQKDVRQGVRQGVRKYSKSKSNWICLTCAESLFDYTPNIEAKFIDGICAVCNENARVSDTKNFNIKLK